jgi:hypothetical protein
VDASNDQGADDRENGRFGWLWILAMIPLVLIGRWLLIGAVQLVGAVLSCA